mgnify:CR=1 FL=1
MKAIALNFSRLLSRIPGTVYLCLATLIFAASNSVTRRIIEIGKNHLVNGRNPISLCNVLFVGNICAFLVMVAIFYPDWQPRQLKNLNRGDWINLSAIGILSGAIAPALIFSALDLTNVTSVVLIGRLEPLLTLVLSVWLLGSRVNLWTMVGSFVSFAGVAVTVFVASSGPIAMKVGSLQITKGELYVVIAAVILAVSTVISKLRLQGIPLGIFSIYRTVLGTVIFFILANALYGSNHFAEALSPFLWGWMFLYASVIVVVGQLCWLAGLRKATSAETNLASSCNPLVAILMAYLILGEVPSTPQYIGGCIILIGIVLSLIGTLRQAKTAVKPVRLSPGNMMGMGIGFKGF